MMTGKFQNKKIKTYIDLVMFEFHVDTHKYIVIIYDSKVIRMDYFVNFLFYFPSENFHICDKR
jgi:hypothetical protein